MFGGGHISIGDVKRRSSEIARAAQNRASNVVASFVGTTGGPDDENYEDVDEQIAVVKQESSERIFI